MDPTYLLVLLVLSIVLFYACVINTGADAPATLAHDHGGHGHGHDDSPQGEPGETAHPHEH